MIFEYYRQKLLKIEFEIPNEVTKDKYENDLPII
jgi:hypothetical protein